jgi:hypothetical protein
MSTTTLGSTPNTHRHPRPTTLLNLLAHKLRATGQDFVASLERAGQRRAARVLAEMADQHQRRNPGYAAELRAAAAYAAKAGR